MNQEKAMDLFFRILVIGGIMHAMQASWSAVITMIVMYIPLSYYAYQLWREVRK